MNAVDTAKNLIKSAAEASVKKGLRIYADHNSEPDPPGPVSVTVLASEADVRSMWIDTECLSRLLGDMASVGRNDDGTTTWTVAAMTGDLHWTTEVVEETDDIRFVRTDAPHNDVVHLRLREAPNDLGTEVSLELDLPIPDLVAKTAAFTMLYRSRALLQTGEIPTLRPLPAARPGGH